MIKLVITMALIFSITHASTQDKMSEHIYTGDNMITPNLSYSTDQLEWLSGSWKGTGLGGDVEEIWSTPKNGQMIGLFRYDQGDELVFTEHCAITDSPSGVKFRVRHFSNNFHGWEDKEQFVEFPLLFTDGQKAYFDGITVMREGDQLLIYVFIESDGTGKEELFSYQRQ